MSLNNMNRAVFLDRDGTIIVDKGYLSDPRGIEFLPNVLKCLSIFKNAGFLLIMVSNQSGIGRGYFDEDAYLSVQSRLDEQLKNNGITFTAYYHCPHTPDDGCECRKPKPLMAFNAAKVYNIALTKSYMIGDKDSDIEFGKAFGAKASFKSVYEFKEYCSRFKLGCNI